MTPLSWILLALLIALLSFVGHTFWKAWWE